MQEKINRPFAETATLHRSCKTSLCCKTHTYTKWLKNATRRWLQWEPQSLPITITVQESRVQHLRKSFDLICPCALACLRRCFAGYWDSESQNPGQTSMIDKGNHDLQSCLAPVQTGAAAGALRGHTGRKDCWRFRGQFLRGFRTNRLLLLQNINKICSFFFFSRISQLWV